MKRLRSVVVLTVLVAAGGLVAPQDASAAPAATPAATGRGLFVSVNPQRVFDTRQAGQTAIGPDQTQVLGLSPVVPSSAMAVVLNVTVDQPTSDGYLTVFPDGLGDTRPTTSSLNKRAGETRSNSVTVALPEDESGNLGIYNQLGTSQVIVDLFGYYDPTVTGANPGTLRGTTYHPYSAPFRAYDSRSSNRFGPGSGAVIALQGPSAGSGISGVTAVAINLTAVDPSAPGYLTAWTGIGEQPTVSTVNYGYDPATPNFAVVPAYQDDTGTILFTVSNSIAVTDFVVDVFGIYALDGGGGATYQPVPPQRLADTREDAPVGPGSFTTTTVPTAAGDVAVAANLNVTGVDATANTYLTAYPDDVVDPPLASNLNLGPGQAVPNAVQTTLGAVDSGFRVYNFAGSTDVVSDLQGYFVAAGGAAQALPGPTARMAVTRF